MIGIGICGYILRKLDYSLSAVLLGFILGGMMEENLRRALSLSNGELGILWQSPIALAVWGLVAVMVALPIWRAWRTRQNRTRPLADSSV
jgi:putative tricarboxylic transport membrane protein